MKQIEAEAGQLEQILQEQGWLADQLYECACQMEHALIENDLDELKKTIENEEDLTGSFAEREGRRQKAALSLGKMLGLQKQEASLLEISEGLEDEELKNRLQQAGKYVAKSISRIQHKNFTVRKMLMLRNEYTDTLLRLELWLRNAWPDCGIRESGPRNVRGSDLTRTEEGGQNGWHRRLEAWKWGSLH